MALPSSAKVHLPAHESGARGNSADEDTSLAGFATASVDPRLGASMRARTAGAVRS